jgi:hypothetical protein
MKKLFRTQNLLSDQFLSPSFVVYDDCVFLGCQFSEESYLKCLDMYKDSKFPKSAVESSMNHIHVDELFVNPPAKVTERLAREAGETIREAWRLKLQMGFPNRSFDVKFTPADPPETSEVSFHQANSRQNSD